MDFEWDESKNDKNIKKHGVSFSLAKEIFHDPLHISILDKRFEYFEERWISIGMTLNNQILVVGHIYTITNLTEKIRIISARKATKNERRNYEQIT